MEKEDEDTGKAIYMLLQAAGLKSDAGHLTEEEGEGEVEEVDKEGFDTLNFIDIIVFGFVVVFRVV